MIKSISHHGVNLAYKATGTGNKSFVLIHNAGGNHQFMDPLFNHFSQYGRVLSLDLRGHGESDKPQQDYTVEGFAEDIGTLPRT